MNSSPTGYHFNPYLMQRGGIGADCDVVTGVIVDPWGSPASFRVMGGVQIACNTKKKHTISATVQEWWGYSANGPWYPLGSQSWSQSGGYGMGSAILVTGFAWSCTPVYWITRGDFTIDGVTRAAQVGPFSTPNANLGC